MRIVGRFLIKLLPTQQMHQDVRVASVDLSPARTDRYHSRKEGHLMKRFPKGRGIIGAVLLALLLAWALCAWTVAVQATELDPRAIGLDDSSLAVGFFMGLSPDIGSESGERADSNVAPPETFPDGSGGRTTPSESDGQSSPQDLQTASESGLLPWIIAMLVVLSIVLVILALFPRKNKTH